MRVLTRARQRHPHPFPCPSLFFPPWREQSPRWYGIVLAATHSPTPDVTRSIVGLRPHHNNGICETQYSFNINFYPWRRFRSFRCLFSRTRRWLNARRRRHPGLLSFDFDLIGSHEYAAVFVARKVSLSFDRAIVLPIGFVKNYTDPSALSEIGRAVKCNCSFAFFWNVFTDGTMFVTL